MSELQVAEQAEVLVPMDLMEAQKLDGRIRRLAESARGQLVKIAELVEEAKLGRVHEALGFKSWTAYLADALGGQLQLTGESRYEVVAFLAGEGMSTRAIATATGVSKSTVANDLAQVSNDWTAQEDSGVQELDTSADADADAQGAGEEMPTIGYGSIAENVEALTGKRPTPGRQVTGIDGKGYRKPKPKPKADAATGPNPRKVVERMAPKLEGTALALDGLDPAEVDGDALREKVAVIRDSIGKIGGFIDAVSPPPKPEPEPAVEEPARKPQVPTVLRRNLGQVVDLLKEVDRLRMDPRWDKATERFTANDRIAVGLALTLVSEIDKSLGGNGIPVDVEEFMEGCGVRVVVEDPLEPGPQAGESGDAGAEDAPAGGA